MTSSYAFSQNATTTIEYINIPVPTVKKITIDLLRGDSALAQLDLSNRMIGSGAAIGKEPTTDGADPSEAGGSVSAAPAEKQLSEGEGQPWQQVKGKSKKDKKGSRSGQPSLFPTGSPPRSGTTRKEADPGVAPSGEEKAKPREPLPSLTSTPKGGASQKGQPRDAEKELVGAGRGLQGEKRDARRSPRDLTPKNKPGARGAAGGGAPADVRPQDGEAQPVSDVKMLRSGKKLGLLGAD
jgi:hypothetical protein